MKAQAREISAVLVAMLLVAGCGEKSHDAKITGVFDSAGAAAQAFADAVRKGDRESLAAMLGPDSGPLLNSGDTVQGRNERYSFVRAYDSVRLLVPAGPEAFTLEVGGGRWPLPLPIVKSADGWKFDTKSGLRELVLRRIGRNELAVLGVCRGLVAAQKEYAATMGSYTTKLRSEAGKHDGLYWETNAGEPESPAGPLLGWAEAQGYVPGGPEPAPYRGYFYRQLRVNSPQHEYTVLAYPSEYGASGIMTFVVTQQGTIYSKDLGASTATTARELATFAPDDTWKPTT